MTLACAPPGFATVGLGEAASVVDQIPVTALTSTRARSACQSRACQALVAVWRWPEIRV
jgi:hypothetical protein